MRRKRSWMISILEEAGTREGWSVGNSSDGRKTHLVASYRTDGEMGWPTKLALAVVDFWYNRKMRHEACEGT